MLIFGTMRYVALITGASSWIWRELAKIHAKKGGDVILVARNISTLQDLAKELEEKYAINTRVISMDLAKIGAGKKLYDSVKRENIEIDILINNAWFGGQWYFHQRNWDDDRRMIYLNVISLTEITKYFLDDMVARNTGKILNVSSTASFLPGPLQAIYFASKSFIQSFSNAIAYELKDTNITVTNLMPWPVNTGFEKSANLENTKLFDGAVSPYGVAKDGYEAMLKWKLDVISGLSFWRRLLFTFISLIPKKVLLKTTFEIQKKQ